MAPQKQTSRFEFLFNLVYNNNVKGEKRNLFLQASFNLLATRDNGVLSNLSVEV